MYKNIYISIQILCIGSHKKALLNISSLIKNTIKLEDYVT